MRSYALQMSLISGLELPSDFLLKVSGKKCNISGTNLLATCTQGMNPTSPPSFLQELLGSFTPCLLLVRHGIPHRSLAGAHVRNQDISMASASDTAGPQELGRGQ